MQIEDSYKLSSMQEGMLFHSLYEQSPGIYIEQIICSLQEKLNIFALKQSWQQVLERHSILRTSFHQDEQYKFRQLIQKQVDLPLEEKDWRKFSKTEQQKRFEVYIQQDRQRGFNIAEVPLMRLILFQLAENDYKLIWTFHHALLDGRSILIILKEVFAFYEAFNQNQVLQLKPANPYRDYIDWLEQQSLTKTKEFWQQQLKGFKVPTQISELKSLELKFGFNRTQKFKISNANTQALKALARENQLTLNTLVQGAWALLLNRYSGQDDVVFGATRACRHIPLPSMESRVGLFINTLPMRIQINSELSLLDWLKTLRSQWVTLRDYEHTPLVKIQEWSEVPKGVPLFESLLVFENYTLNGELKRQGEKWKYREFELLEQPNYPLTLAVYAESELSLKIDYDCRSFDDAMIARMLGHIETLLNSFVANHQRSLGEFSLLTEAEKHQLLVEWNDTQAEFPKNQCIHELFEEQVEKTPNSIAVVFEDQQLTYQELNNRANQLAHYLQTLGVKPEMLVGICMERAPEMVVSLLGILKARGAYVPIEPTYPKKRIAHLMSDSQMSVLLTQQNLLDRLPENEARIVCLDGDWRAITQESKENPVSDVKCDNLSYVIYTSGTTGLPKGVTIEHSSVLNLAMGLHQSIYTAQSKNHLRVSLNGSLAFDTSVKQIIQLLFGHTLEIIPEDLRFDGSALLFYLQHRQLDVFDCTPSQLGLLISAGLLDSNVAPQCVLVGGEPINQSMWSSLSQAKHIQFFNVYGPTECTVDSTVCDLKASKKNKSVIGRPIANTQVYILDSNLQPVPMGIPGELHIGGAGLARGYLNRPELTSEKFIPNPFSDEPKAKLYKTGDLVRYLPDGNMEFLGRIDNQVKIRGFRIELGEVEAVLGQHPSVRESVVVVREDETENKRLVSYIVPNQETINTSELRRFLKQKLPDYMMPSTFVILEALPLNPNGKIDRKALPKINWTEVGESESLVASLTPVEEILIGIWSEVLGLKQIGINDNFLALGGHSLKATQVISRMRDVFSFEFPVRCLFDFPTVIDLSKHIENIRSQKLNLATTEIPLQPISRDEELVLSFAQQRLWFLNQLEGQNTTYKILSGLHLNGTLNEAALQQSITEIVERHEILRTTFSVVNGVAVQVIRNCVNIPISSVNLETLSDVEQAAEVQRLVLKESQRPFDLAHDLLLRFTLLRLGKESHILLLTIHHIVSDGWSMGIFFQELSNLYAAFFQGESASLPNLTIQYADFAHWQRQWLTGEVLESQLKYLQQQLTDVPPLLDLPTDRPRPPVQTFRGSSKTFELSEEVTQKIKQLGRQSGTTLFMTLLAAFVTLLSRYSNQEDIVVGSPIAGRNRREIESLIGLFVNTLVLRVNLEGNPSFLELLKRTRQVALDAYTHQDLPFEKLVEELKPERNLSYNPLFQVMFVLQNAESEEWEIPGLTLTPLEIESVTAKFDLTLAMEERESGLRGVLEYNSDLFDAPTITRMLGHFQTLLAGIVANPEQRLSALPLLTEVERHQLLVEWNDTQAEYPKHKCIHQLFEEQVKKTPDAVAVVFENEQLTYQELNARANQLAHYLQNLGVKPETLVGICVKRSLLMVIGLLGILKAGGAYVPLDPNYPQERLTFMLEDAQVSLLLTQQILIEGLPQCSAQVVDLDSDELWLGEGAENLNSNVQSDNLAYVLYTSGSTGQPKGVAVEHRSVVALLSWATEV